MTKPRHIVPGALVMVTTRCVQRFFKLAPSKEVNELFEYLLAYTSAKYNVGVIAAVAMSNHAHMVAVDHDGRLPDMLQEMNMILARGMNHFRGEHGTFFDRNNVDIKSLEDDGALFVALGYLAANPVAAGCVERGADWVGVHSCPKDMGAPGREVKRPEWLFLNKSGVYVGELPETAILRYELPPGYAPEDRGQAVYLGEMAVHLAEKWAREKNARRGVKYLGRALCWNADHNRRGIQWEPHGPGSGPDPIMATSLDTLYAAEIERQAYLDTYAEAIDLWQQGDHAVIFPFGTWNVVRHHAAVVAVPPPNFRRR
jgi:REP element-mobilizing transposase RayT